jgi:transposase
VSRVFGEKHVRDYVQRQERLIRLMHEHSGKGEIIDASKSDLRLEAFRDYLNAPLRVIVLTRRRPAALGARIKRARRRTKWYNELLAPIYIFWLYHKIRRIEKIARSFPQASVFRVDYEDFVNTPEKLQNELSAWYGREVSFGLDEGRTFYPVDAHVITGNIWLTRNRTLHEGVTLKPATAEPELTQRENAQYRMFAKWIPSLR